MPKKITMLGYTIKELEPEVKQKVIDKNCEINTMHDWYEVCYNDFDEKLSEYGLECKNYGWDLYHNEFDLNNLYIVDQNKLLSKLELSKHLIPMQIETEGEYDISISLRDGIMVAVDVNIQEFNNAEIETVIHEKIADLIHDLKKEFLKELKDEYEYQTSEEAIVETLEANDYLFTKEGKVI